jgi:hypothetical protein
MLVLASDNQPLYREFRKIWQSYCNINKEIKVLFYYGASPGLNPTDNDLVFPDIKETYYPGMIQKMIRALEHINTHYNYTYLIRTNLSTFWDLDSTLPFTQKLPTENLLQGMFRHIKPTESFISGTALFLSKDMTDHMIRDQELIIKKKLGEDHAITDYFKLDKNIQPKRILPHYGLIMEHYNTYNSREIDQAIIQAKKLNYIHYRIKNKDRTIDIPIAEHLRNHYYPERSDKTVKNF